MDFSDSFFHDTFRADATISYPEPIRKEELSATAISELVPSGISSSFDQIDWPDSFRELAKDHVHDHVSGIETQRASPKFFMDDANGVSLADSLTSQATFCFDVDVVAPETKGAVSLELGLASTSIPTTSLDRQIAALTESITQQASKVNQPTANTADALDAAAAAECATSGAVFMPRRAASDFKSHEEFKAYKVRREKNNEASRRSRTKFRQKAREMEEEVHDLREENNNLKKQLSAITAAFEALRREKSEYVLGSSPSQSGDTSL